MFEEKSDIEIVEEMLNILCKESEIKLPQNLSNGDKRAVLKDLMLVRPMGDLNEYFIELQNALLSREMRARAIAVDDFKFSKKKCFYSADILDLKVDMIVVFTDKLFANFNPDEIDINAELILRGGVNINEDLAKIYYENKAVYSYKEPYIVSGYNLACQYVAKILLPNSGEEMLVEDIDNLRQCVSELFDFVKEKKFHIIAIDLSNISKYHSKLALEKWVVDESLKNLKSKKIKTNIIFVKNNKKTENKIKY